MNILCTIAAAAFLVLISYAPIVALLLWWNIPEQTNRPRHLREQIAWKVGSGIALAVLYSYVLPVWIVASIISLPDFLMLKQLQRDLFLNALLVGFMALLIALASQQADYVNRLSDMIHKHREAPKPVPTEIRAAYYLVSCGFWGFSLAVLVTFGLIWAHFTQQVDEIFGAYEGLLAALILFGWTLLLSTALRHIKRDTAPPRS